MFRRLSLPVALLSSSIAFAQNAPPPTPQVQAGSPTRERPGAPVGMPTGAATPATTIGHHGGSLLRASMNAAPDPARADLKSMSVFAVPEPQPKTIKKHDLVTIIIREESETSSQGTADLKRESDIDAGVDSFVKLNVKNLELEQAITGAAPRVTANANRAFKGEATVDRSDSVIARITAEVLDVKPNGTLVVQARKKIKTDEEEQTLLCSGICRVEDITPDNTVLSTQLYDLEFTKINKGQVRNTTKSGVIHKLLDFINPF
jgi:flagellar L-ring protein precursor FlgH